MAVEEMSPEPGVNTPYRDHDSPERVPHSTPGQQDNPDPKTESSPLTIKAAPSKTSVSTTYGSQSGILKAEL